MKVKFFCIFFLIIFFSISQSCKSYDQNSENPDPDPETFSFTEVPDPLSGNNPVYKLMSISEPSIGDPFKDPHFNTTLIRVTSRGKNRHEYSRFDPFNKDQSMVLLHNIDSGDFFVNSTGQFPLESEANNISAINNLEEIRWDPVQPLIVWGQRDFSIIKRNVQTGGETVVKDFSTDAAIMSIIKAEPDLYRITMRDEGESSINKQYWCFLIQGSMDDYRGRYLFCWDKEGDNILGLYKISKDEASIDWVGMSAQGNFVLIGGDFDNGGNLRGLTMANRELTRFHQLAYSTSHSDIGLDKGGKEVIVMQNDRTDYIDMIPIDWNTKPILEAGGGYEGTNISRLVRLYYVDDSPYGMSAGVHISCNYPGYCVISTFIENGKDEKNWLDRVNILVRLDKNNPHAFYLSKVYNTCAAYWEETHATISNDGSKVLWSSNWGKEVGDEMGFLIQLNMPENWDN